MKKFASIMLFLYYILAVQFVVIGYLRKQELFYYLAGANFLALSILTVIYVILNKNISQETEKKFHMMNLIKYFFSHYFFGGVLLFCFLLVLRAIVFTLPFSLFWVVGAYVFVSLLFVKSLAKRKLNFGKKLFLPKDYLFWTSFLILLLVFKGVGVAPILGSHKLFLATFLAFVFFVLSMWVTKAIGSYSVWKLFITKIYLLILGICFPLAILQQYYDIPKEFLAEPGKWQNYVKTSREYNFLTIKETFLGKNLDLGYKELDLEDGELLTGVGEILTSSVVEVDTGYLEGFVTSGLALENSGMYLSGNIFSGDVGFLTGDTYGTGTENPFVVIEDTAGPVDTSTNTATFVLRNAEKYSDQDALQYDDVIVYLLESNAIEISQSRNIKFDFLASTSEDYKYFITAFEKKLIGKTLKPEAKVKCDNYLVMKGLLQGRDVESYAGTVFQKYFQAAKEFDALNGCEPGNFLKIKNL